MSAFDTFGVLLALSQFGLALLVLLSTPAASKRGGAGLSLLYAVIGFATVVWMMRAALWQG